MNFRNVALLFFVVALLVSCKKGKHNDEACNGDPRRDVKLMRDAAAAQTDTAATSITLEALGNISVPEVKGETDRLPEELVRYTVRATVDKVKRETDGDYHIRLTDGTNYLITECPNPSCTYAEPSPYVSEFQRVRDFIDANKGQMEGKEITITGIAFVDIDHHYKRKQAKNNIELHPILDIHF